MVLPPAAADSVDSNASRLAAAYRYSPCAEWPSSAYAINAAGVEAPAQHLHRVIARAHILVHLVDGESESGFRLGQAWRIASHPGERRLGRCPCGFHPDQRSGAGSNPVAQIRRSAPLTGHRKDAPEAGVIVHHDQRPRFFGVRDVMQQFAPARRLFAGRSRRLLARQAVACAARDGTDR